MSSPSLPSEIVNTLVPRKEGGGWIGRIAVSLDVAAKVAVASVLITTAVLKLASIVFSTATTGSFPSGNRSMVLPFISEGMELIAGAVLELVVCWVFVRAPNALMRYATVAWISTCFLGYRYILHVIGTDSGCGCSGFWPGIFQGTADAISTVSLAVLLIAGWGGLALVAISGARFWPRRQSQPLHRVWPLVAVLSFASTPLLHAGEQDESYLKVVLSVSVTNLSYAGGASPIETPFSFRPTCVFGGGKWSIQTRYGPSITYTYFCDGDQVISVARFDDDRVPEPPDPIKRLMEQRYGVSSGSASSTDARRAVPNVAITPGSTPLAHYGANLPWFVYCSSGFLSEPGRSIPALGVDVRHNPTSFGYIDEIEHYPDSLGLPRRAVFRVSEKLMRRSPGNSSLWREGRTPEGVRLALNPSSPFPDGFEQATYEVTSITNFEGWTVPLSFRFLVYDIGEGGVRWCTSQTSGYVESLEPSQEPSWPLFDGERYVVVDHRFRHRRRLVDNIRYEVTNGILPSATDPRLVAMFEDRVASAALDPVIRARYGFYGVSAMLAIVPLAAIIFWLKHRTRKTHITHRSLIL